MADDLRDSTFSDFLSDLSVAVVIALQTQDDERIEALADHLAEMKQAADESEAPDLAAYFKVLRGLVRGEDVATDAEKLVDPYRAGYERIAQELEEKPEVDTGDALPPEWLAKVTSLVAATVKRGSEEDRAEVERELASIAQEVQPEERRFHDFMAALRGVLRGEDPHEPAAELQPPYRQAYQSLLQLLAADDTTDFALQAILDRIEHNTIIALTEGDLELRVSVAEALADVAEALEDLEEKLPEDDASPQQLRALILGAMALLLDRDVPTAVDILSGPFAETWHNIRDTSQA